MWSYSLTAMLLTTNVLEDVIIIRRDWLLGFLPDEPPWHRLADHRCPAAPPRKTCLTWCNILSLMGWDESPAYWNRQQHIVRDEARASQILSTSFALNQPPLICFRNDCGQSVMVGREQTRWWKDNTTKERTYMFCRAMDSKRSVMADKDETEKKRRVKMLKVPKKKNF